MKKTLQELCFHLCLMLALMTAGGWCGPVFAQAYPGGANDMAFPPGPGGRIIHVDVQKGSNINDGTAKIRAYKSIQYAISKAERLGDTILVWPGFYPESLNLMGKAVTVVSATDAAIIKGPYPGSIGITCQSAEGAGTVLMNLVICDHYSGLLLVNSSPSLINLTVANNMEGIRGRGGSNPFIRNCIFWNGGFDLYYDVNDLGLACRTDNSCFKYFGKHIVGTGNISNNPLFADEARGDYHLRSQRGRFWPVNDTAIVGNADPNTNAEKYVPGLWVLDNVTSPCVDAGDPMAPPMDERMPNGGRIDMGAYGNTPFASLSEMPLRGDINRDGRVDMFDYALLANDWLEKYPWVKPMAPAAVD